MTLTLFVGTIAVRAHPRRQQLSRPRGKGLSDPAKDSQLDDFLPRMAH